MLDSMQDKGLPLHHDMFSSGKVAHGCGHSVRTVYKGIRTTGADFLHSHPSNLHILTETLVDKVIIEGEGEQQHASGAVAIAQSGEPLHIRSTKDIIISCGTYCTPTVLMRSGIGDRQELAAAGIEVKVPLSGVGKNLMDHLVSAANTFNNDMLTKWFQIVFIFYEAKEAGLTTDHLLYHGDSLAESYRQWKEERRGALASFPFGAFAYARLDERLKDAEDWNSATRLDGRDPMGLTRNQPNVSSSEPCIVDCSYSSPSLLQIEFFTTECYGGPKQFVDFPIEYKHCFSIIAELFAPRSRGTVTLKSADPHATPVINHNYLSDPLDVTVLSEACAFGNEIVTSGRGTKDILKGSWPENLTHHTHTHRDQWRSYVRDNATTCYHPGGTAKMGKHDDPLAVVDARLRVFGVKGLRVADCSVMPKLNQGHTQMPAYGIGEKAAELIAEDHGLGRMVRANIVGLTTEDIEAKVEVSLSSTA